MKYSRRAFALSLLAAGTASAQLFGDKKKKEPPTRTVKGEVMSDGGEPVRAVVQLKNTKTLNVKSFHANAKGEYYFHGLDLNVDYQIKAFADGYEERTRTISTFDDRTELIYNFELKKQ
jgi:hypothetical protein